MVVMNSCFCFVAGAIFMLALHKGHRWALAIPMAAGAASALLDHL